MVVRPLVIAGTLLELALYGPDCMLLVKSLATSKFVDLNTEELHITASQDLKSMSSAEEMMIVTLQDGMNTSTLTHQSSWDQCLPLLFSHSLWSSQSSVAGFTSSHNSVEQVKDAHYHNRFPLVSEDGWHAQFIKTIASPEGNEMHLFLLTVVCKFRSVWPLLPAFSTTFSLIVPLQYLV